MLAPELLDRLAAGEVLLTGNARLAQTLTRAYHQARHERGERVWESPGILAWPVWLARTYTEVRAAHSGLAPSTLLNDTQEQLLWERIVAETAGERLLQIHAAASQAREAWRLVQAWHLPWPFPDALQSEDSQVFASWADAFQRRCRETHLLEAARLADVLASAWREYPADPPPRLILAGFDELSPRQRALFDVVEAMGGGVERLPDPDSGVARAGRLACPDRAAEYQLAARWARALLEANAQARVGVVVPELQSRLGEIERVFESILSPGAAAGETPRAAFNISLGQPLAAQALVADALTILDMSLQTARWPLERVSGLLRSPFVHGAAHESAARALLDADLREGEQPEIGLNRLIARLAREQRCEALAEMLLAWRQALDKLPKQQSFGRWAMDLSALLKQLGWPGEREINSHEYQAVQAWRELLAGMARLDAVSGQTSFPEAVARLRRLAAERVFQPESAPAPIQIMGVLEAAGQRFDHLWVCGLHDGVWPPPPRPNPFIPYKLQRERGVPHAGAERELEFTRRVTRRLMAGAPEVVLSYPRREGEEDLSPSGLLAELEPLDAEHVPCWKQPGWFDLLLGDAQLESFADDNGPALVEGGKAEGGSGLFKAQSHCPFQAFVQYRLRARPLGRPEPGLDAAERGSLVHAVLQHFWQVVGGAARLHTLDQERTRDLIEQAANRALREQRGLDEEADVPPLFKVERQRLIRLTADWLEIEKQRAPFTVVAIEAPREFTVGGIRVTGRIDRMDRLDDGRLLMLDYKTGRCNPRHWFEARPEEPQLPLYAVSEPEAVSGVAFAQLRPGDMRLLGVADGEPAAAGIKSVENDKQVEGVADWAQLLEHWRAALHALGEEYRAGYAEVAPADYPRTCNYCPYGIVCRVEERMGARLEADQAGMSDD